MGIKATDINLISTIGPTATTPLSKSAMELFFQVTRQTLASTLKLVLPADASITSVSLFGSTASNAATSATVTINISNNSGVISTGSYDVKANGATTGALNMSNLPNLEPLPLNGDLQVSAVYAETGTASTLGGPWTMRVGFVR